MHIENPKQIEAASAFNQVIITKLTNEKGVHAETAISAVARMAGTYILRASGVPLEKFAPGTSILVDFANEQGQQVLGLVDQALASLGVPFDSGRLNYDLEAANNPQIDLQATQSLLDPSFQATAARFGLTDLQTAASLAIAVAFLIQQCAGFLDPHVAYVVATYGMVEGSKTVPFDAAEPVAVGAR
jgi:hypothetical protein